MYEKSFLHDIAVQNFTKYAVPVRHSAPTPVRFLLHSCTFVCSYIAESVWSLHSDKAHWQFEIIRQLPHDWDHRCLLILQKLTMFTFCAKEWDCRLYTIGGSANHTHFSLCTKLWLLMCSSFVLCWPLREGWWLRSTVAETWPVRLGTSSSHSTGRHQTNLTYQGHFTTLQVQVGQRVLVIMV